MSQADGLCYPASEVGSEELGVQGEMHKEFLLWILFRSFRRSEQVEAQYPYGTQQMVVSSVPLEIRSDAILGELPESEGVECSFCE